MKTNITHIVERLVSALRYTRLDILCCIVPVYVTSYGSYAMTYINILMAPWPWLLRVTVLHMLTEARFEYQSTIQYVESIPSLLLLTCQLSDGWIYLNIGLWIDEKSAICDFSCDSFNKLSPTKRATDKIPKSLLIIRPGKALYYQKKTKTYYKIK